MISIKTIFTVSTEDNISSLTTKYLILLVLKLFQDTLMA